MIYLFWISMLVLLYIYFGYPIALMLLAYFKKPVKKSDIFPMVSIIIPAYNEENIIAKKIENCLALDYPKDKLEIVVCSDGSTDKTNSIVEGYGNRGVRLDYRPRRVGKCAAMNRCINVAKGEIILFSDADAMLEGDSLKKLMRNFADPTIGCVEGVRRDRDEKGALLDSLYWRYETWLKKLNGRLGSLVGATGALYAIRKSLYRPISAQRGDDFEIPIRAQLQGYKGVLEPEAVAYHPWLSNKDEFGRIVRIVSWMMPSAFMLLGEAIYKGKWLLALQLVSHKILRWFMPVFMIAIFISNLHVNYGYYKMILWSQILFYTITAIGFVSERMKIAIPSALKVPYFFSLINTASLAGIIKLVLKKDQMNWTKTARN